MSASILYLLNDAFFLIADCYESNRDIFVLLRLHRHLHDLLIDYLHKHDAVKKTAQHYFGPHNLGKKSLQLGQLLKAAVSSQRTPLVERRSTAL